MLLTIIDLEMAIMVGQHFMLCQGSIGLLVEHDDVQLIIEQCHSHRQHFQCPIQQIL